MPIYEYECTGCAFRFELKQSFSENTPVSCPRCGGAARRVFSPVALIFKGSGFYITDSRANQGQPSPEGSTDEAKAGPTDKAKAGTTDKAKAGSTDDTKTDTTKGK